MGSYISSALCTVVGFAYPTYASFKAIESDGTDDDTQWLTYWVIYSIFGVIESFTDRILFWFPFYYEAKLGMIILLQVPGLNLATQLYKNLVRPFLHKHEKEFDAAIDEASTMAKQKVGEFARTAGPTLVTKVVGFTAQAAAQGSTSSPPTQDKNKKS